MPCKQSGTSGKVNRTIPKHLQPILAEMDSDMVHCPIVVNKHWMFDPQLADVVNQLADVVNQFAHSPIWLHQGFYPGEHQLYVMPLMGR